MACCARYFASLPLLLALSAGAADAPPAPAGVATPQAESTALMEARQKVRDLSQELGRAEADQKRLSPPIRTYNADGSYTFDADRQRSYERENERLERRIRDLRQERASWEMRVNRVVQGEAPLIAPAAAPPAPAAAVTTPTTPPAPRQESAALQDAKRKVRELGYDIGRAESELNRLSPPIRIHQTNGTTTFNADKQKAYEADKDRLERRVRDLRKERSEWELRANRIQQQDAQQAPRP